MRWSTTLAWAGLIFYLSTGTFGGSFTEWLLTEVLRILHLTISDRTFAVLHFLLRKGAHLTEYAIFALLLYSSLLKDETEAWRPRTALVSVLITGLYSLSDEFHQSFVPGRGPSLKDCALDTAGAILAMLGVYLLTRLHRRWNNRGAKQPQREALVSSG
jgi:VanZ family protein